MRPMLLLLVLSGCASLDWRTAVQADTSAAYLDYAAHNPTSAKLVTARRRAEDRLWSEALAANTSTAFAAYFSAFPGGDHAAEAQLQAQELGWTEAAASSSAFALAAYATRWPASPHAPEARARVEDLVYGKARQESTDASWGRYLVQYPNGRYAAEALSERDRLVWEATFPNDSRQAYQRYLDEFPNGVHAEEVRVWLHTTYVPRIRPLVALVETWQPASARAAVLARLKKAFDAEFVPDLKAGGFEVLPTRVVDATRGLTPPQELLGIELETGILVLEYREKAGRTFDPSGIATDITAVLRLYAPNTRNAVWVRTLQATTPDQVRGTDLAALNQAAIEDLVNRLHVYRSDIASQHAKRVNP